MGIFYSKVRKLIKSGDKKNIVVNDSPTVYKITSIFVRYGRYIIVSNRFILVLTTVSSCTVYIIIRISDVE
jgi:hypothetical protein